MIAAILAGVAVYQATVLKVVDGDTIRVEVKSWPAPFNPIDVRVKGIDTPEHSRPPAQTACEVPLGLAAATYAKGLAKPGDRVRLVYTLGDRDKYGGRILAAVRLADGRDWGATLISAGFARSYGSDGNLRKSPWCEDPAPAPEPGKPEQ